jgi:hypothetical protein
MIKIWRVENESGRGCYNAVNKTPGIWDIIVDHDITPEIHPQPILDKGICRPMKSEEICGFINLSGALDWFTIEDLKVLLDSGFKLKEIEVKEITAIGQKQVLAIRD